MDEIKEYTIKFTAPQKWSELSKSQLKLIAEISDFALTKQEILFTCFCRFCKVIPFVKDEKLWFKRGKEQFSISDEALVQLINTLSFIIDEKPKNVINITKIPDNLHGIQFVNYYKANALFFRYEKEQKMKYFRKGYKALTRHPFFGGKTKAKMILFWWYGVMDNLKEKYPFVFDSGVPSTEFSPMDNLREILAMVTELHPELNNQILTCEVHEILLTMNEKIRQYKEIEKMRQ